MKNIFYLLFGFLLLSTIIAQAQSKWVSAGDSIAYRDDSSPGTFTLVAVQDTAGGSTDTLVCEVYDESVGWISCGISKMTGRTWETEMIPGNGSKAYYLVNYPTPTKVRVRRTNVTNLSSKTKVNFSYLKAR